jgi:SRSO17 transposase
MRTDQGALESEKRFTAYVEQLASVMGHAARKGPLIAYCMGLLMPLERKSVEPLAALTEPGHVSAQHQSLLHFVGEAPWSDEAVLAKVCALGLPSMARQEPIAAWIIDDTAIPKKGKHSVGGGASVLRAAGQASQLPSSGSSLDRQSSCQSSHRLASLSASGMDQGSRTLQKGKGSEQHSF